MSFVINAENSMFFIEGIIDTKVVKKFKNEIKEILELYSEITINLIKVDYISVSGLKALIELNLYAFENKKIINIEGKQLKSFYQSA